MFRILVSHSVFKYCSVSFVVLQILKNSYLRIFLFSATWIIALVTFQRYLAVCRPHMYEKWASLRNIKLATYVIWITCAIYCIPKTLQYYVKYDGKKDIYKKKTTDLAKRQSWELGYYVISYYIIVWIIPFIIIFFATYYLIINLNKATEKRKEMGKESASEKVNLSLIMVVVIFFICNLTNPMRRMLRKFILPEDSDICPGFYFYYRPFGVIARMFNSAINFAIYILCSRRFRLKVFALIRCRKSKVGMAFDTNVSSNAVAPNTIKTIA